MGTEESEQKRVSRVIKRDGRIVKFNKEKIVGAVSRAMEAIGVVDNGLACNIADKVAIVCTTSEVSVEDIQDKVEDALIEHKDTKLAKAYILYRAKRAEVRGFRDYLGIDDDDIKLGINALSLLEKRYLKKHDDKKETPSQMFRRVARAVSAAEKQWGNSPEYYTKVFYNLMANQIFLPNTPCLANAGNKDLNNLFACYAFEIGDSMEEILQAAYNTGMVQKTGGGVGLHLSKLRPSGDFVKSTEGIASGPVTFMQIFDTISEVIKQGGIRRGGNLGLLLVSHPDIVDFINCKLDETKLNNFNISVAITDEFMRAVKDDTVFNLISPKSGKVTKKVSARQLFSFIVESAWTNGEPGIVFWDKVQKDNPTPQLGYLIKNLCGEQDLLPYEACFASDTLISTNNGLERIEALYERQQEGKDVIVATNMPNRSLEYSKSVVTKIGEKAIVGVELVNGQLLKVTPDHRILTTNGWKEAVNLCTDDKVFLQKEASNRDVSSVQLEYIYEMFGWMVGDGWFTDNSFGLVFGSKDDDARNKLIPIWKEFTESNNKQVFSNSKSNCSTVSCEKINIRAKFKSFGFSSSYSLDKRVPSGVFTVSANLQKAFIRGLFSADGGLMWSRQIGVRLASSSIDLLRDVQLLLINLGIKSRIGWYEVKSRGRSQGTLCVQGKSYIKFKNEIGFLLEEKTSGMRCSSRAFSDREVIQVNKVFPCGNDVVYDIYEPTTNSLIANGMVVHNCVLGSINLSKFVDDGKIIYASLKKVVHHSVRFLDNVLEVSNYPLDEIEKTCKGNRKIGLGIMGFADLLCMLEIPYNSDEGVSVAEEIMEFINIEAVRASEKLAEDRGDFLNINGSMVASPRRNASLTTIAPTGSISIIAECSGGIEPLYGVVFQRSNILDDQTFFEVNPIFEDIAKREGWYSKNLINSIIKNRGKVTGLSEVPSNWQKVFVTALEIQPEWHIKMQAAFQRHTNNSISKTINLPNEATVDEVGKAIQLAYDMNLKGVTVFRDESRSSQVLCVECVEDESCAIDV